MQTRMNRAHESTAPRNGTDVSFNSEESKIAYDQALKDRHHGMYQDAADALERIIEV